MTVVGAISIGRTYVRRLVAGCGRRLRSAASHRRHQQPYHTHVHAGQLQTVIVFFRGYRFFSFRGISRAMEY